jgi:hypothetical protein
MNTGIVRSDREMGAELGLPVSSDVIAGDWPGKLLRSHGEQLGDAPPAQLEQLDGEADAVQGHEGEGEFLHSGRLSVGEERVAHSLAALVGQVTVTAVAPRRSSIRISGAALCAGGPGKVTGTKEVLGVDAPAVDRATAVPGLTCASCSQRRRRLALIPWARATAAIETP